MLKTLTQTLRFNTCGRRKAREGEEEEEEEAPDMHSSEAPTSPHGLVSLYPHYLHQPGVCVCVCVCVCMHSAEGVLL